MAATWIHGHNWWFSTIFLVVISCNGCKQKNQEPFPRAAAGPSVLLITLDTTRADRLGCYGHTKAQTPVMDEIARSGILFEQAYCQVPLTLPSHTSLLTGTYPATNGVRVNGEVLGIGIPTLAEVFRNQGYRTGAFVSAIVLDSGFGLDRGFDTYDDNLGTWDAIERPATAVNDSAIKWLGESLENSFFAWIHFFDPHSPHDPPIDYRERLANPYDAEIAFVDSQIGRVLDWLETNNLRESTMVIVVGDHGEAFGEHKEKDHGLFLYEGTMHVPMIISLPGPPGKGHVVKNTVALLDVFPTIVDLLGWELHEGLEGVSLKSACQGGNVEIHAIYGETEYPHLGYGWAALRSLTTERWKYIEAPQSELYERTQDPNEESNLIAESPTVARQMRQHLFSMTKRMVLRAGRANPVDAEIRSRLESLGYVGGRTSTSNIDGTNSGRDPKDMVDVYNTHSKAVGLLLNNRDREVVPIMESLVQQSPESDEFFNTLGRAYLELGRNLEAQQAFESSLRLVPDNPRRLWRVGEALRRQNKLTEAIDHLKTALAISPDLAVAHCSLGDCLKQMGKTDEAIQHYELAVKTAPNLARAFARLGVAYAKKKQFALAYQHLLRYVELEPTSPHALVNLGNVALQLRRPDEAVKLLRKALAYDPNHAAAHQSLNQVLIAIHKPGEAIKALRVAHEALQNDRTLTLRLAWMLGTSGRDDLWNPTEALRLVREIPEDQLVAPNDLAVLAAALAANGDYETAIDVALHAIDQAYAQGLNVVAQRIEKQLLLYEVGKPYRE